MISKWIRGSRGCSVIFRKKMSIAIRVWFRPTPPPWCGQRPYFNILFLNHSLSYSIATDLGCIFYAISPPNKLWTTGQWTLPSFLAFSSQLITAPSDHFYLPDHFRSDQSILFPILLFWKSWPICHVLPFLV